MSSWALGQGLVGAIRQDIPAEVEQVRLSLVELLPLLPLPATARETVSSSRYTGAEWFREPEQVNHRRYDALA